MGEEAGKREKDKPQEIETTDEQLRASENLSPVQRRRLLTAVDLYMNWVLDVLEKQGGKDPEELALNQAKSLYDRLRDLVDEEQEPEQDPEAEEMIRVLRLERTCLAVPSQWEGGTANAERVYIRYRWGTLRVDVEGETVYEETVGDDLDGYMEYEDLKGQLAGIMALPEQESYGEDWEANWGPILGGDR